MGFTERRAELLNQLQSVRKHVASAQTEREKAVRMLASARSETVSFQDDADLAAMEKALNQAEQGLASAERALDSAHTAVERGAGAVEAEFLPHL
jgi:hypothetical protein